MSTWNTRSRLSRSERNGTLVLLAILLALTAFKRPLSAWLAAKPAASKSTSYTVLIQQIEQAKMQPATYADSRPRYAQPGYTNAYAQKPKAQLEVNSASAADWETLYGIGPVLAARIVNFREGLGGFQRIDQLRDVYGIKPDVFEQIRPRLRIKPAAIRRLNINEADAETLAAHPYIPPTLAKQFVGYRSKVKPFESLEDIKNLYYLRDHPDLFEKLSPYLTVN